MLTEEFERKVRKINHRLKDWINKKKFPLLSHRKYRLDFVMYQEFVVCNIAGNCITNAENSTIFYFKSVSTWQEKPTAHVRSA